jgi:hypothetical protein
MKYLTWTIRNADALLAIFIGLATTGCGGGGGLSFNQAAMSSEPTLTGLPSGSQSSASALNVSTSSVSDTRKIDSFTGSSISSEIYTEVATTSVSVLPSQESAQPTMPAITSINNTNNATKSVLPARSTILLAENNVTGSGRYLGSFRVPVVSGSDPYNWSGSSGRGAPGSVIWYKETGANGSGSLIIGGRATSGASFLTEISIPVNLDNSGNVENMPRASFLVSSPYFFDLSSGRSIATAPGDSNGIVSGGVFISDGNLYQNWGSFYQGALTTSTYFKKTGTDVAAGSTTGPFAFAPVIVDSTLSVSTTPVWYRGVVSSIPSDWQSVLGGRFIQSQAQYSNSSPMGYGPALFAFDPSDIGASDKVPNQVLLAYTDSHPIEPQIQCVKHSSWTRGVSRADGTIFPSGSGTVLVSSVVGMGVYQYGTPGQIGSCGEVIVDPLSSDKGYHSYPYVIRFLAYSADDLAKVKSGIKKPYDLRPYSTWNYSFPGYSGESVGDHAMAYDDVAKRLFIVERETSRTVSDPIIHVYQLLIN